MYVREWETSLWREFKIYNIFYASFLFAINSFNKVVRLCMLNNNLTFILG